MKAVHGVAVPAVHFLDDPDDAVVGGEGAGDGDHLRLVHVQEPRVSLAGDEGEARGGVHGEEALHEALALVGDVAPRRGVLDAGNDFLVPLGPQILLALDFKGPGTAEHGVDHDAKAPQVRPLVVSGLQDLRGHEVRRPHDRPSADHHWLRSGIFQLLLAHVRREAEVGDLDVVQLAGRGVRGHVRAFDQHVLELEVAVDDVLGVHVGDAVDELQSDVLGANLGSSQAAEWLGFLGLLLVFDLALDFAVEVAPCRQVHDQQALTSIPDGRVQVHDPGMVELLHVADLSAEILALFFVEVHRLDVDNLNGVLAACFHAGADEDCALPALAELAAQEEGIVLRPEELARLAAQQLRPALPGHLRQRCRHL
mmetsp:Transcript_75755/g.190498  ORF Transcript_75755/g.190498 Transcript_75755/m.190498 type:complete len:368 (+) Transcript_75755:659-1762(+)